MPGELSIKMALDFSFPFKDQHGRLIVGAFIPHQIGYFGTECGLVADEDYPDQIVWIIQPKEIIPCYAASPVTR
jgi:hypothetical protein